MDRFVALLWDDRSALLEPRVRALSESLRAARETWAIVIDAPGIRLFVLQRATRKKAVTMPGSSTGAIIGSFFRKGDETCGPVSDLTQLEVSRIVATSGAALLNEYWGGYLAMWRSSEGTYEILRDPSGAVPCYFTSSSGIQILCSFVADIAALPGVTFSVDRLSLSAFLARNIEITRRTGLAELTELLPGERLTLRRSGACQTSWAWSAPRIARPPKRRALSEVVTEAREISERCFAAWSRSSDNIVVRLSGGLDSSVVAALTRRHAAGRVTALHLVGKGYEAHEVAYARLAAQFAGVELVEIDEGSQPVDYRSLLLEEVLQPRPTRQIFGSTADKLLAHTYAELGADTVMTGHGGDIIFFQRSMSGLISADDLQLNGPSPAFWRRCYDTATLLERSVWGTAGDAFAVALRPRRKRQDARLSPPEGLAALFDKGTEKATQDYLRHPLSAQIQDLPPAKAMHVGSIHALRDYHALRGHSLNVDNLNPLISQPIMEFALETPVYLFGALGVDRLLERHAFQDLLPDEIFRRTSKGFVSHELTALFQDNLAYFRELVLEGELVKLFDLDRGTLESFLTHGYLQHSRGLGDMMNIVAAEVWLSSWMKTNLSLTGTRR